MITVEHLTKRYGEHTAVDDLSFTVEDGEICGLLGPNGAGKTTTMNILTGYISATEGTVLIDGVDIFEEPEKAKRRIGYLPEVPPVYSDMTPMEYLRFVTELRKIPKKRRTELIDSAIERTDIRSVTGRLICNLSKGYRQRVGLAAVLACDPSVVILDEPTVGLDPKQIIEIRELIRSLGQEHTVLLSSHILSEVSAVCNKVLILSHGKLVAYDTPENLEKRTQESCVLTLSVLGEQSLVRETLLTLFDESALTFAESESGCVRVRIACSSDQDRRAEVSLALARQGIAVTELHAETQSLEDVFLELTDAQAAPEPEDAEDEFPRDIALDANGRIVLRLSGAGEPESCETNVREPSGEEDGSAAGSDTHTPVGTSDETDAPCVKTPAEESASETNPCSDTRECTESSEENSAEESADTANGKET